MSPATSRTGGAPDDDRPAAPPSEPPSRPGEPPTPGPLGEPSAAGLPGNSPAAGLPGELPAPASVGSASSAAGGSAPGVPGSLPPGSSGPPATGADPWTRIGHGGPAAAEPPPSRWRALGVHLGTVVVLVLLGLPFGLLWAAVAPGVPVLQTENGAILAEPQPEEFIAADGWFSLLGFAFGVLAAIAAWALLRRYRGPAGMVAVVVGMLGAATLAWQVGRRIGLAGYERLLHSAPAGASFTKPPDLHGGRYAEVWGFIPAIQDLLVPAFGAVVVYTLVAGWSRYPDLRPGAGPVPPASGSAPISWGSAAPPAPPAAPAPPGPDGAEPPRD